MEKKKKIGLIVGIVVALVAVLAVIIAIIAVVVILNLPVNQASRAINNGNYEKLAEAYDKAGESGRDKIEDSAKEKALKCLDSYIDDKISYSEAESTINGLSGAVGNLSALAESSLTLSEIKSNKENYALAQEAMNAHKYGLAYSYFTQLTECSDGLLKMSEEDMTRCAKLMQEELVGEWSVLVDLAESVNEGEFVEGEEDMEFPVTFKIEFKDNQTGVAIISKDSYESGLYIYAQNGYKHLIEEVEQNTGYTGQDAIDYADYFFDTGSADELFANFIMHTPYDLSTFSKQFQYEIDGGNILISDDVYDHFKIGYTMNSDGTLTIDLMGYEGFKNILDTDRYNVFDMHKEVASQSLGDIELE